ncbi:ribosome biogenesis protein Nop53/GLTSCR2 [Mycotypha africana]|uniref:ribosome biogenesis protein Nop53/GLTSCR2 n=1 Tax=Mycotypha africana TaxID=64632 RepID=UPI0023016E95|nr:ribosome biogenesis protein Nop53/GLTSCR2 [Mycotypha africana]KAI8971793.1 ribosome biogenesis protein Nop53/GLTSCR2 [Mycotypha africana]
MDSTAITQQQQQQKKLQPSRKGKKAWRKNIDITDVEEGQEELRAVERVIGGDAEALKDDELFTIDTEGDNKVKRQLAKEKPLRVDEILQQRSAVPAVQTKKNPFKKPEMSDKIASKHEYNTLKRKLESNASITNKKKKNEKKNASTNKSYDLWGDDSMEEDSQPANDFTPAPKKPKAPKTFSEKPTALHHIPAVDTPAGGQSYNPTMEDHQQLIIKASEVEQRKVDLLKQLQEQLSYREELKQLKDELAVKDSLEDDEDLEDKPEDDEQIKKQKAAKRKTRQERQKSHRLATAELEKKQKKQEKLIRQQIDQLRAIEKELVERMEELDKLAEERGIKREEEDKKGKKRLGKYFVPELPVDVQLTDELCETLRQLKVSF